MKKKVFLYIILIAILFTIVGCNKSNKTEKEESKEKVSFTVESKHNHVVYKLPESAEYGFFKDLGHSCNISYYTNQTSVAALYPYDDKVEKVNKITINDFNYDTYKYIDNMSTTYIYRTKVNKDYHLFTYSCVTTDYDDSQVEKFMNTVTFVYDSITSKQ